MEQNKEVAQQNKTTPPGELPVTADKSFYTHTMEEDVAKAQAQGDGGGNEATTSKPFSKNILSPSAPPTSANKVQNDKFREKIEPTPAQTPLNQQATIERDQSISLPRSEKSEDKKQFQIRVPQQKKKGSMTSILVVILTLLIVIGGFGYYWFFIKEVNIQAIDPTPTPVVQQPIVPQPVIPQPSPDPIVILPPINQQGGDVLLPPPTISQPDPTPIVESNPALTATTTLQPDPTLATPSTVEPNPIEPQALFNLDKTITITLAEQNNALFIEKLIQENIKITDPEITIRYIVKLSNESENRFLSGQEIASLLEINLVSDFLQLTDSTFELIGYKEQGIFRYGFVSKITNKETMKIFAKTWENTMLNDLNSLYLKKEYTQPEIITFSQNTYFDFDKRYINLPQPEISLDYAVSGNYFIVATSKNMIYAILDKALGFEFGE